MVHKSKFFMLCMLGIFCVFALSASTALCENPYIFRNSDGVKIRETESGSIKTLDYTNKRNHVRDGDVVETDAKGSADIFLDDGSVIRLFSNSLVSLDKIKGKQRKLWVQRGDRFTFNIKRVPTTIHLPNQDVLEGEDSIVYLSRGKTQMEVEAVYVNGKGFNWRKKDGQVVPLKSGEKFFLPLSHSVENLEEVETFADDDQQKNPYPGRTLKFAGKVIVLPDGVTYKLEEGKLVIYPHPKHFKGPKAVKIGDTIVIIEKDSIVIVDLKGNVTGSNLFFLYFPPSFGKWGTLQRRPIQDPPDTSPETP